jgi:hypothetical protein
MIVTERDYQAQREYYRDQARAASRHRLVRRALADRQRGSRLFCTALTWLGERFVAWGTRLQEQYDTVVSASAAQSANSPAT